MNHIYEEQQKDGSIHVVGKYYKAEAIRIVIENKKAYILFSKNIGRNLEMAALTNAIQKAAIQKAKAILKFNKTEREKNG